MNERWQAPVTPAPTDDDRAAIERTILDYYEGWYTADPDRMARALHPNLAKRSIAQDRERTEVIDEDTAQGMVDLTREGRGRGRASAAPEGVLISITDISGRMASTTVQSGPYFEYLHLWKTPDGWQIINALWKWADGHGPRA